MRNSKNRYFYHIFVSPGDAPGAITLNIVWMERDFDAYKLSRFMCPSIGDQRLLRGNGSALEVVLHDYALYKSTFTLLYFNYNRFWDRARYWSKIVIFSYPLAFGAPVKGVPVGVLPSRLVWKKN